MTITFVGHGYVGLVTACAFAGYGNKVWVIGRSKEKINRLKKGDPIIYEPGLKELLQKNIEAKRLDFTLRYEDCIPYSDVVFIAVGTPPKTTGEADLASVYEVAEKIGKNLRKKFSVASCKSTVPVGTNKKIKSILDETKPKGVGIAVASCPEFLREGSAIHDTLNPDRVVIGTDSRKARDLLLELHEPINGRRVITDLASAELIKYTSNAMLATKISFSNLISFYCEKIGADVEAVLDAVGLDRRIGRIFMNPGVGYGGSCLPKDLKAIISVGKSLSIDPAFFDQVDRINQLSQENFLQNIFMHLKKPVKIGIWGMSFKPNTDDIRDAPSLSIIGQLLQKKYKILAYDPAAQANVKKIFGNKIQYCNDLYSAAKGVSALIILTEWNEFKQADLVKIKKLMISLKVFDGRNIYDRDKMKRLGFKYYSIGRPPVL